MDKEIWKEVKDYEGLYEVSNYGNVRSVDRYITRNGDSTPILFKGKLLKKHLYYGYQYVHLSKKGSQLKAMRVHRLVAIAFIPNPKNLPMINHKDENKSNNYVDNLEWCDAKYNMNYNNKPQRTITKLIQKVYQYDMNDNLVKIWNSGDECAKYGFSKSGVSEASNNRYNRIGNNIYKGYKWSKYEYN